MPTPLIGYRKENVLAGFDICVKGGVVLVEISIAQLDRELAAISHGVARIQSEVEKGVFELSHFLMQR
jgi:hypothetical protein